jgi:hypothetical protein
MAARGDIVRAGVGWPTHLPGLAGPALSAVIVTALVDGRPGLADLWSRMVRWRIGWGWWALVAGTAAVALLGVLVPVILGDPVPAVADFGEYTEIGSIGRAGVIVVAFVVNGSARRRAGAGSPCTGCSADTTCGRRP